MEARAEARWKEARSAYRDADTAWRRTASRALRLGDSRSVTRSRKARAALAALLRSPQMLDAIRQEEQSSPVAGARPITLDGTLNGTERSPAAGGRGSAPVEIVSATEAPQQAALEKLQKFLQGASSRLARATEKEERDLLLVSQMEALVGRFLGDGPQREADRELSRALAALASTPPPASGAGVALWEAQRLRLLYKLREFRKALALLASTKADFSLLSVPERQRHLTVVRDLARFAGDERLLLAARTELSTLGGKAEETVRPGMRFPRLLIGSAVDLAQTAQALLGMLAGYRLSAWEAGLVSHTAGIAAAELGEYALAGEILSAGMRLPTDEDPWLAASLAARLGRVRGEIGEHEAALDALDRADSAAGLLQATESFRLRVALNASRSYLGLGQLDEARQKAERVLRSQGASTEMKVRARILLGDVLYEKARLEPALLADAGAVYRTAMQELEAAAAPGDVRPAPRQLQGAGELQIGLTINLANVLRQEALQRKGARADASRKEAIQLQDRAMRAAHAAGLYRLAAIASANLGELHLETGKLAAAKSFVEWALARARENGLVETEWRCHWYLGRVADAEGRTAVADAEYVKAEAIVDSYRSSVLGAERKAGFLTDKMGLYRDLVRRSMRRGRADQALAAAERSKARALLDSLGWRFLTLSDPEATQLYREFVSLVSQVEAARTRKQKNILGVKAKKIDVAALKARLTRLRARIARSAAGARPLRLLTDGRALDARGILEALPANGTLVEYFALENSYVALVAAGGRVEAVSLDVRPLELQQTVTTYILGGAASQAAAGRLYSWLFEPIQRLIHTRRILVVPHGVLHEMPFETLRDGEGRYLVSRFEFVYLPSASLLAYVGRKGSAADAADRRRWKLMAIVDPDTDYDGDGKPDMPPLPFAREEVAGFATRFASREVLTGPAALKSRCAQDASVYDVIHYAGHGEFYPERPWDSSLFLAPPRAAGARRGDGRLRAAEIYGFDLRRSRLVALSGCETGRSRILPGDDTISIATAFLYCGASSLLVSLWKVEDAATAALMKTFYRKWLDEGKDKAEALRESKLELLAGEYSQPRQWAAFVLIGEP